MSGQQEILDTFLELVRQHHPTATEVYFETSDQDHGKELAYWML